MERPYRPEPAARSWASLRTTPLRRSWVARVLHVYTLGIYVPRCRNAPSSLTIGLDFGIGFCPSGGSQAVRLPKALRLPGAEVTIERHGKGLLTAPVEQSDDWVGFWACSNAEGRRLDPRHVDRGSRIVAGLDAGSRIDHLARATHSTIHPAPPPRYFFCAITAASVFSASGLPGCFFGASSKKRCSSGAASAGRFK